MKLNVPAKDPTRKNWCGPTALAILTGLTYEAARDLAAASLIKRGRSTSRVVKGLGTTPMVRALKRSDAKIVGNWKAFPSKPTLMRVEEWLRPRRFYLVLVGWHYVTVNTHDWTCCCNWTRAWVPLRDHPFNLSRVRYALEVVPAPAAFAVADEPQLAA